MAIQVGVGQHPKSIGGKMLTFAWCFFTLVLVATYTANLAAFFAENAPERPLASILDIPNSKYNVATYSSDKKFLERTYNEELILLMQRNRVNFDVPFGRVSDPKTLALIEQKLRSDHVWIAVGTQIEELRRRIPDFYFLDGYFSYLGYGFAMRKDWKYADQVERKFTQFGRSGMFYKMQQAYAQKKPNSGVMKRSKAIDIDGYLELLYVMVILGALSSCITVFQMVVFKWKKSRRNSVSG